MAPRYVERTRLRSSGSRRSSPASQAGWIGEYPLVVPARLVARLFDGSEHEVKVTSTAEHALQYLVKTDRKWVDVVGGSVRYESIIALLIVEERTDDDRDRAVNELLRELRARGGGTQEEVKHELELRGIEVTEPTRTGN